MPATAEIAALAQKLLRQDPEAPVRVRLLRDVLGVAVDEPELRLATEQLGDAAGVCELAVEQHADGGWGRFHTRDTAAKQRIINAEYGVQRALALGLDVAQPVLRRARDYIAGLLEDPSGFPDDPEHNDRWETGVKLFLAGTLALIDPQHVLLEPVRALWVELAKRTFASGQYREQDEIDAHRNLTGATVKDSYLVIDNRYAVALLSSQPELLPKSLEKAFLKWLLTKAGGVGYLEVTMTTPPSKLKPGPLDRWFATHELLSRFSSWRELASDAVDWLWAQQNEQGLWDLGARGSTSSCFPLSANWRKPACRIHDWSARVLALLSG